MKRFPLIGIFVTSLAVFAQGDTGSITGRVLGVDGKPAAGVRVALASEDAEGRITANILIGLTVTDGTGRYRIDNIPPGRYGIVAGAVAAPTFYPGTASVSGASVVRVERGLTMSAQDFPLATTPAPQSASQDAFTPAMQAQAIAQLNHQLALPGQMIPGRVIVEGPLVSTFLPNLKLTFLAIVGPPISTATPGGGTIVTANANAIYVGSTEVKLDGTFRVELKPVSYRINVGRADGKRLEGFKVKSITLGTIDLLRQELKADKPLSGEIIITLQSVPISNPIKL